ncbi:hypothetical protein LOTGIDRAFT_179636 [Lottia gigantea]|uniref:Protein xylosyltransferase n=1 Tax=Lottia gigantea TaxID=225164 RepID=V3ZU50_LOTGI|nr:hypothetical protein LOTGIDRAFT_179636 [Lottia gigantea]ESO84451.1 hypothetical protein LOTGIDRAFT_179636 [Lottia gigantea]
MDFTEEEAKFPLAFSIMMYKDANQVEELLRAIYRPHNYYCIHVDAKADLGVHHAIQNITRCLKNVQMASRSIKVVWGKFSVLESELICMRDLLSYSDWKYFINLTGQEYPLKTNSQIVKILKLFHGANSVDVAEDSHARWRRKGRPPHGIKPRKGNIHVVLNRQFVNYTIINQVSKDFIKWLNNTIVPDETLFASLNHNPQLGIPGSYIGMYMPL